MATERLGDRFGSALAFAADLHRRQQRKGSDVPYVAHLLAVAAIAIEHGATEDEAIAALLHDAIEDQGPAYAGGAQGLRSEIRGRFGEEVLAIVEGCTDADTEPKPPWKERKSAYLAHLEKAPRSVLLVACADKLHNVRSMVAGLARAKDREAFWKIFNGGRDGSLWYYRALGKIFLERFPGALAEDLARAVLELTALAVSPKKPRG